MEAVVSPVYIQGRCEGVSNPSTENILALAAVEAPPNFLKRNSCIMFAYCGSDGLNVTEFHRERCEVRSDEIRNRSGTPALWSTETRPRVLR